MVTEGVIAADIARNRNIKKSHVSYYIKNATNVGYVRQATRDAFQFLSS